MRATNVVAGAALAVFASTSEAALASFCAVGNEVCFQWGAPQTAISSGSGNVYFQLRASASYAWFALGTGTSMKGSSMFVVYNNGENNVTLSTRTSRGHSMPAYTARSDIELLKGSGIVDGNMVANVRCTGCSDIGISTSSPWISAWKMGSSLDSSSPSADIRIHDGHDQFSVNLQQASITSDSNPFLTTSSNGSIGGDGNGASNGNSGVAVQQGSGGSQVLLTAHGVMMAIVFIAGYPIGSSIIPLIGNWILHASWQLLAFLGMWAAFGIGYTVSMRNGAFFADTHTRLGVIVCAMMGVQPVLGWLHHQQFIKTQRRGIFSHIHMWSGRGLMILGIVNGGLGLQATNQSARFVIAYSVLAGVVSMIYTACAAVGASKRRKQSIEKTMTSSSMSDVGRQQSRQSA